MKRGVSCVRKYRRFAPRTLSPITKLYLDLLLLPEPRSSDNQALVLLDRPFVLPRPVVRRPSHNPPQRRLRDLNFCGLLLAVTRKRPKVLDVSTETLGQSTRRASPLLARTIQLDQVSELAVKERLPQDDSLEVPLLENHARPGLKALGQGADPPAQT